MSKHSENGNAGDHMLAPKTSAQFNNDPDNNLTYKAATTEEVLKSIARSHKKHKKMLKELAR